MDARSARKYSKDDWTKLASEAENKIEGRLFINGEYVDATDGGKFEVINPATNEVYATVAAGTEKDIDKAVSLLMVNMLMPLTVESSKLLTQQPTKYMQLLLQVQRKI